MRKSLLIALAVVGAASVVQAQEFTATATLVSSYEVGAGRASFAVTPGAGYSDRTNFTGFGAVNGGATSTTVGTLAVMDDLNLSVSSGAIGKTLGVIFFSVYNSDPTTTITARPRVRMFDTSGSGGGPGTNTLAVSFAQIAFAPGTVSTFTSDFGSFGYVLPASLWEAMFFDANFTGSTTTVAQLNMLGQGLFNPVDVGTSADRDFVTTAAGAPGSNPAGSIRNSPFANNPAANYGWELNPVPEPTSMAILGVGALALLRRRKKA